MDIPNDNLLFYPNCSHITNQDQLNMQREEKKLSRRARLALELKTNNAVLENNDMNNLEQEIWFSDFQETTLLEPHIQKFKAWQATRNFLMENLKKEFEQIQNMERLVEQKMQQPIQLLYDIQDCIELQKSFKNNQKPQSNNETENNSNVPRSMPQYICELLKTTEGDTVVLGSNGTKVNKQLFIGMNWTISDASIIRKILTAVFGRETLTSHTLSGKQSPAFIDCNKATKMQLDPAKIDDIICFVKYSLGMPEKEIIANKCADDYKTMRIREEKKPRTQNENEQIDI